MQNALTGKYQGDMPHNWASAECIRYLRHIGRLKLTGITGSAYKENGGIVEVDPAMTRWTATWSA